jgi:hypothetical protein
MAMAHSSARVLPNDALVGPKDLVGRRVAQALRERRRALDVREQDRAKGVGGQGLGPDCGLVSLAEEVVEGPQYRFGVAQEARAGPAFQDGESGIRYPRGKAARNVRAEPGELSAVEDQGRHFHLRQQVGNVELGERRQSCV